MSIADSDTTATHREPTAAARAALVQHIQNVMEEIRSAQAQVIRLQTELSVLSAELRGLDRAVELGRASE
jgi:septal ring factor EnvC (AmiA/AmiB activator)